MIKDHIALQLYSVRDYAAADLFGVLEQVRAMGYTGVEFAGLYGYDPLAVKEKCAQLGLTPISAHVPLEELTEDLEGTLDCYEKLGCRYVAVPYLSEEYRPGTPGFEGVIESVRTVGAAANRRGMVLQYHNHDFEFVKIDGEYGLDRLYRLVGPELLQTQLDTCWVNVGGEDPVDYLKKYAGRIPTVHLKDFVGNRSAAVYQLIGIESEKKTTTQFEYRPLGKGLQNIPAIVEAAVAGGAEWFIVEQDEPSMGLTSMECAAASAEYLLNNVM